MAERLLARASRLDAEREHGVRIEDLRAAAVEAGIAASAFEAALQEVQTTGAAQLSGSGVWLRGRWWIMGAVAAIFAVVAVATAWRVARIPQQVVTAGPVVEEAILLHCLAPEDGLELVRPLLQQDRVSRVSSNPRVAPRVIVLHTTPALMQRAKALLAQHEGGETGACPVVPQPSSAP